ncbi:glycosyltransferase family 2 protein [Fibrobacter sp.]|uniref:glycosyltransferase family 2 protein n=1 Tax=Fibrobacter sp. TaxID=35828 RepID=UPI0025B82EF4|nr:glycosyltransferase family 2 protein [Fibrobacter sp.]MBR4006589.1 glycosyltransferase family 2 protein [Fibrobacter sp.]
MNDVVAGIVLYNPDIERLQENLSHIVGQVAKVICVDNGSKNIDAVNNVLKNYENVEIIYFSQNKGIACALNEIVRYAEKNGFSWVLTLDQDSVCDDSIVQHYRNYIERNDTKRIGCITCFIKDRNFDDESNKYQEQDILYCITSGSLMNTSAMREVGYFDEKMFIDKVDVDICINLRNHGYRIVQIGYVGLLHEIGHAKQINLGFRKWELYNHSSFRRYYMCRNASYLLLKYRSSYVLSFFLKEIFQTILVFVFEKEKLLKLKVSVVGFIKGFLIR